jgi:hypothetical protein
VQAPTYFILIGLSLSFMLALTSASYQKKQGHSFFQTFFFGFLGLGGLTFGLWSYIFF